MATTDQELKKLNKTVDDAVNILKIYVGNSATIKNMNEKQREAVNKWFNVVTEEEQQQKRQRAFTERLRDENGRFIKKRDDQAKKMMGVAGSITGMFKNMTTKVGSTLKNIGTSIVSHVKNIFGQLQSHFLSLFGEESEWFSLLGSIKDSISGVVTSFVGWMWKKTPRWAKDLVGTLKDIYALQLKQMKMDWVNASPKKNKKGELGIWGTLGLILVSIAAGIGAWLHRKLIVLTAAIPFFKKIGGIFAAFKELPAVARLIEWMAPFTQWVKGFLVFLKESKVLAPLIKGLKFGFKWLGWPLTILMSVIDFIKGYSGTEGTMFDKVKEGLWKALEGFIELPVKFVGWLIESVLGWFGIEVKDVSGKMMAIIKNGFMMIFDGWALIFEGIKNVAIDVIKPMLSKLVEVIKPIVIGVHNFFVEFWNSVVEWMISKLPDWLPYKDKIAEGIKSLAMSKITVPETGASPIETVQSADKAKTESQKEGLKKLGDSIEGMAENVKESNKKTAGAINSIITNNQNNQSGFGDGGQQQIPDEIDNGLVSISNYGGGMA
jgi:hypothetical protein